MTRRGVLVMVAVVLVGLLGGCSGPAGPMVVPKASAAPLMEPTLTLAQATEMIKQYDVLNNKAIDAAKAPRYDPRPYEQVAVGPELEVARLTTAVNKAAEDKVDEARYTHSVLSVHAAPFTGYPALAFVTLDAVGSEPRPSTDLVETHVMLKAAANAPWKLWAQTHTLRYSVPAAVAAGGAMPVTPEQQARARAAVAPVLSQLERGTGKGVAAGVLERSWVKQTFRGSTEERGFGRYAVKARLWSADESQSVRVVRTASGTLVSIDARLDRSITSTTGKEIHWASEGYAKVLKQAGGRMVLSDRVNATILLLVPDSGTPSVIGFGEGWA